MDRFMDALEQGNLETLRKYPKADLHNHFALGGSRRFLYQATGKKIEPLVHPLASMAEMDQWSQKYIGQYFNSTEGRKTFNPCDLSTGERRWSNGARNRGGRLGLKRIFS